MLRTGTPCSMCRIGCLTTTPCLRPQNKSDAPFHGRPAIAGRFFCWGGAGQGRSQLRMCRSAASFRMALRPCNRRHVAVFCMSLRGAGRPPRDVAIRSPAAAHNEKQHFGRIRKALRICPKDYQFAKFLCGDADCHVASLLAMTCKRLSRCYVCKRVPPGQARNRPRIRLKCYFSLPFSAGRTDCRTSVRTGSQ